MCAIFLARMAEIVQYVVMRGDLARTMGWPLGAVVAQACHACTAVIHLFYNDAHTQAYLADLDNMHKVVLEVSMTRRKVRSRSRAPPALISSRQSRSPLNDALSAYDDACKENLRLIVAGSVI